MVVYSSSALSALYINVINAKIVVNELPRVWKEAVVGDCSCTSVYLKGLMKTTKNTGSNHFSYWEWGQSSLIAEALTNKHKDVVNFFTRVTKGSLRRGCSMLQDM